MLISSFCCHPPSQNCAYELNSRKQTPSGDKSLSGKDLLRGLSCCRIVYIPLRSSFISRAAFFFSLVKSLSLNSPSGELQPARSPLACRRPRLLFPQFFGWAQQQQGMPDHLIQALGRWSNAAYLQCIRTSQDTHSNAVANL